jgi:Leucine-rich repeat (LRR) protein
MSAEPTSSIADTAERWDNCISDLLTAVQNLRKQLPQVNDPALSAGVSDFVEKASNSSLSVSASAATQEIADRLNDLWHRLNRLDIRSRDSDLGPMPTLASLEQAVGLVAIRLIAARHAAAALGWRANEPAQLPVPRNEVNDQLAGISKKLVVLEKSVDRLAETGNKERASPNQFGLISFYVQSIRAEINLAKVQMTVGDNIDLSVLWRIADVIVSLTTDFYDSIYSRAQQVAAPIRRAIETVRRRVGDVVSGVRQTISFALGKDRAEPPADFNMGEVRRLVLSGNPVPRTWVPFVTSLDLSRTRFSEVSGLKQLTALQRLFLGNTPISDLSPLSDLTNIRELNLERTHVENLSLLRNLTNLQIIFLGGTQVRDLSPLANLSRLQSLVLWSTRVDDVTMLYNLTKLEIIDLNNTQITEISSLENLSTLRSVGLNNTAVTDFTPLASLKNLKWLGLAGTAIDDISSLSGLTQLEGLDLSRTRVSDISPLAPVTSLQSLELWDTWVHDVSSLSHLRDLQIFTHGQ